MLANYCTSVMWKMKYLKSKIEARTASSLIFKTLSIPASLDIGYHNVLSSTYCIFMNLHFAVGEGAREELPTRCYKSFLCEVGHQQTIYNH